MAYEVLCIKSDKERVPKYRFHHVEISKNILTPNTMLKFIPHLRDMKEDEEQNYTRWIHELETMDIQSGFKNTAMNRHEKMSKHRKEENAAAILPYIERWVAEIGIEGCSKSALIHYMASQSEMTPQQKNSLAHTRNDDVATPRAVKAAKTFTEAFDRVYKGSLGVTLKDVLQLDESVETMTDPKRAKDKDLDIRKPREEQFLTEVEAFLGSYTILGCLICYSHSCEHGDYDRDNQRRAFSIDLIGKFGSLAKQRLAQQTKEMDLVGHPNKSELTLCKNQCWLLYDLGNELHDTEPYKDSETMVLRSLFTAIGNGKLKDKVPCMAATLLGRLCWDVNRRLTELNLSLPSLEPPKEPAKVKQLNWYDRTKKMLLGDWQEHTNSHEHARRALVEPCTHSGPCGKGCACVDNKLLCERFCRCTEADCAYKFTGCACHASGKTCLQRQKEGRPCICVQLNRECDPILCKCGAFERADPRNAHDKAMHSTGCQNVPMQRGVSKAVLLGQSQLEACGYGLFTAEDIPQDEFVIEYLGELITHDEGVRREARRGDVFDQENNSSYLFTLLDVEGIWVDAAVYGNLSRYINHASSNKNSCNIIPKILYVNGEFRIKFCALRDIKAGEELFFNYGENFPNLTKKLLDSKEGENGEGGAGTGKNKTGKPKGGPRKPAAGKKFGPTKQAPQLVATDHEDYNTELDLPIPIPDDDPDDSDWGGGGRKASRVSVRGRGRVRGGIPRILKRKRGATETPDAPDAGDTSDAEIQPASQATRGVHGGRRPGAGRKGSRGGAIRGSRARRTRVETPAASASFTPDTKADKDVPESPNNASASITAASTATALATTTTATASPAAKATTPVNVTPRNKRRRRELDLLGNDNESVDSNEPVIREPPGSVTGSVTRSLRRHTTQHIIADSDHHSGESDDDDSPNARSSRKRVKPARYREDE